MTQGSRNDVVLSLSGGWLGDSPVAAAGRMDEGAFHTIAREVNQNDLAAVNNWLDSIAGTRRDVYRDHIMCGCYDCSNHFVRWPTLEFFGSWKHGVRLPGSDFDVSMHLSFCYSQREARDILTSRYIQVLAFLLDGMDDMVSVRYTKGNSTIYVKLHRFNIEVDLSAGYRSPSAWYDSVSINFLSEACESFYKRVMCFTLVQVKYASLCYHRHNALQVKRGQIRSFHWVLLVLAYLRNQKPDVCSDIAGVVLCVLRFYSEFDFLGTLICPKGRGASVFRAKEQCSRRWLERLVFEDIELCSTMWVRTDVDARRCDNVRAGLRAVIKDGVAGLETNCANFVNLNRRC